MLGEHILENNPDCQMNKFGDLCNPPIIEKEIDETKTRIHVRYNSTVKSKCKQRHQKIFDSVFQTKITVWFFQLRICDYK